MQTKDYYKILEIPPSSTLKEIKAAYRKLAHQYHPDKNYNNPYFAAQFEIIKEAYEILSNPSKKDYYLQQRWYDQSMNIKQTSAVITPVTILKQLIELEKYVSTLDVHRMDKEGLYAYISHILSDETIEKLNRFNEKDINKSIVDTALKGSSSLPISYIKPLSVRLMKLNSDPATIEAINNYVTYSKRSNDWNKYKIWVVIFAVLFICLLIYAIGH